MSKKLNNPKATTPNPTSSSSSKPSPPPPTRICVFCSATTGRSPSHLAAARELAETLHAHHVTLIYGGGSNGMMGELAKTLVRLAGKDAVLGIIPEAIVGVERASSGGTDARNGASGGGWIHKLHKRGSKARSSASLNNDGDGSEEGPVASEATCGKILIVPDLAHRKKEMARLIATGGPGSGFIALSGGFGTMDEMMEVVTLHQFGVHKRKVCFYNVEGYWDGVTAWIGRAIEAGFVRRGMGEVVGVEKSGEACLRWLADGAGG
ncbi:MAG: hypothetical protein OHK93_000528 [Ramalina farinacea]|uniref:Cytokinin riboside 5'-monophosphate phosphoribohydrolase n=1 Tax=Ramalina farinacea TaxID=258253 RepID=A0AA43QF23_9LECA|nr:hypothetical protein [Ramalina farinacea]